MAWQSAAELVTRQGNRTCGRKPRSPEALYFSSSSGKDGRGAIIITIGRNLLQRMRWLRGDRVDLSWDVADNTGLISRTNDAGWALTPRGGSKKKECSLDLKITWREGMPSHALSLELENVTITDEGILFKWPKETSFNGFARQK